MHILLDLFLTFAKIGMFTFGGGYAMISMIEHTCVEKKQWITHDEMMNVTVIAESTPGPIAINCATFTGYKQSGFIGALIATLGMIVPSFLVIYLISMFLDNFLELTLIACAFKGIKLAVGILILDAAVTMIKKMPKKKLPRTIMICAALIMLCINLFAWNFSSISLMLLAAAVSLVVFLVKGGGGNDASGSLSRLFESRLLRFRRRLRRHSADPGCGSVPWMAHRRSIELHARRQREYTWPDYGKPCDLYRQQPGRSTGLHCCDTGRCSAVVPDYPAGDRAAENGPEKQIRAGRSAWFEALRYRHRSGNRRVHGSEELWS